MAEVSKEIIKKGCELMSITDFKNSVGGVSTQAIDYAISKDLIDYIRVDNRVRVVAMTKKTKSYKPNKSKVRKTTMKL